MTLFEVGIILAVVVIIAGLGIPSVFRLKSAHSKAHSIACINNQKQIGIAYKIWEADNGDLLPMGLSITNGGSMEAAQAGDVVRTFLVMSNELYTPKILFCPSEPTSGNRANDFVGLAGTNISYFVVVDVTNSMVNPQMIISGDSNFELDGKAVRFGLNSFGTNQFVAWSASRHDKIGNIGLLDCSVQSTTSASLQKLFLHTGLATNRFAIP